MWKTLEEYNNNNNYNNDKINNNNNNNNKCMYVCMYTTFLWQEGRHKVKFKPDLNPE